MEYWQEKVTKASQNQATKRLTLIKIFSESTFENVQAAAKLQ